MLISTSIQPRHRAYNHPARYAAEPPQQPAPDQLLLLAEGALAGGLPALGGAMFGSFGALLSTGGGAVVADNGRSGRIQGAAIGLLGGTLGAAMGPSGVLLAASLGAVVRQLSKTLALVPDVSKAALAQQLRG